MTTIGVNDIGGLADRFKDLPDPRSSINRQHLLVDVIVIAICAVLAGADGPAAIEQWARAQQSWLAKHLRLPYGIPSHDTIGRVLEALLPRAFQECFVAWLDSLREEAGLRHLAIDGKTLRRSHDRGRGLGPLHLVSVWARDQGVSLGQLATAEKSNETTAIPELLDQIELNDAVVTIDAAGCQKEIAKKIVDGGGDYVLALKGNQGTMHRAVKAYFEEQLGDDFAGVLVSRWKEQETAHGRQEQRYYYQVTLPADLADAKKWRGLKTIGIVISITQENGVETGDVRYYLSSLRRHGRRFARLVRGHWAIENTLHWTLDMTFREDESRVRARRLGANLAWLRRLALTLLKQHPKKQSLAMKRRIAGWNVEFLTQVLLG